MTKRWMARLLITLLFLSVSSVSVFAKGDPEPAAAAAPLTSATKSAKREPKLRSDMLKLVADAKAGKMAPRPQTFPNTHRNNLSTGAKIGIAAGIGAAIFLIIMFHQLNSD